MYLLHPTGFDVEFLMKVILVSLYDFQIPANKGFTVSEGFRVCTGGADHRGKICEAVKGVVRMYAALVQTPGPSLISSDELLGLDEPDSSVKTQGRRAQLIGLLRLQN